MSPAVQYFLDHGIIPEDQFILIVNNRQITIPNPRSNVEILYRDNVGSDFDGWGEALIGRRELYDTFIFINSSCIGPFVHPNIKESWISIFILGLDRPNVKLFGSTINCCNNETGKLAHVQSWAFCLCRPELNLCWHQGIFDLNRRWKPKIK